MVLVVDWPMRCHGYRHLPRGHGRSRHAHAFTVCKEQWGDNIHHYYKTLADMEDQKECELHDGAGACFWNCEAGDSDFAMISMPCQPFSQQQTAAKLEKNGSYKVCFGEHGSAVSTTTKRRPKSLLVEEVCGFNMKYAKSGSTLTPMQEFVSEIMAITDSDGKPHFTAWGCVRLDCQYFVTHSRPRRVPDVYACVVYVDALREC